MNFSAEQIEQIVSTVVARLRAEGLANFPDNPVQNTEFINSRIVSTSQLDELPDSIRSVRIANRAVITPAAKDWLNENGVQIIRADCTPGTEQGALLAIIANSDSCSQARRLAARHNAQVEFEIRREKICERVLQNAQQNIRSIVISKRHYQLAVELNRFEDIFAVAALNPSQLEKCLEQTRCNSLLINAFDHSDQQIDELIDIWIRADRSFNHEVAS